MHNVIYCQRIPLHVKLVKETKKWYIVEIKVNNNSQTNIQNIVLDVDYDDYDEGRSKNLYKLQWNVIKYTNEHKMEQKYVRIWEIQVLREPSQSDTIWDDVRLEWKQLRTGYE